MLPWRLPQWFLYTRWRSIRVGAVVGRNASFVRSSPVVPATLGGSKDQDSDKDTLVEKPPQDVKVLHVVSSELLLNQTVQC